MPEDKQRGRQRANDIDKYVGTRIRERRLMLGLTQQQLAELMGVTYQQGHKYEKGLNRISAGRLWNIAAALGVDVGYFYEGVGQPQLAASSSMRMRLELARDFNELTPPHQHAVLALVRRLGPRDDGNSGHLRVV